MSELSELKARLQAAEAERDRHKARVEHWREIAKSHCDAYLRVKALLLGRPYVGAWLDEVLVEAAHQRQRWGTSHDAGKEPQDWYWLVGYLAGKALRAQLDGDAGKARHHTVSTAAVCAQWAAAICGDETVMRPGIGPDALAAAGINEEQGP